LRTLAALLLLVAGCAAPLGPGSDEPATPGSLADAPASSDDASDGASDAAQDGADGGAPDDPDGSPLQDPVHGWGPSIGQTAPVGTRVEFEVQCGYMDGLFTLRAVRNDDGWWMERPDGNGLQLPTPRGDLLETCFESEPGDVLGWSDDEHLSFDFGGAWHELDRVDEGRWLGQAGMLDLDRPGCRQALDDLGLGESVTLTMSIAEVLPPETA
jgi:hypothetical protein